MNLIFFRCGFVVLLLLSYTLLNAQNQHRYGAFHFKGRTTTGALVSKSSTDSERVYYLIIPTQQLPAANWTLTNPLFRNVEQEQSEKDEIRFKVRFAPKASGSTIQRVNLSTSAQNVYEIEIMPPLTVKTELF